MSQLNIICPHCGLNKKVDRKQIPANIRKISCPKCKKSFPFSSTAALNSPVKIAAVKKPLETSLQTKRPVEKKVPAPVDDDNPFPPPVADASAPTESTAGQEGAAAEKSTISAAKSCLECGQSHRGSGDLCLDCVRKANLPKNPVSKLALIFITFFLGGIGAHKIYQKNYLLGGIYFLFCWTLIPGVIAFVEFIMYIFTDDYTLQQRYPEACCSPMVFGAVAVAVWLGLGSMVDTMVEREAEASARALTIIEQDLFACSELIDEYLEENGEYPTDDEELLCETSPDTYLFYLSDGPGKYQLIGYAGTGSGAVAKSNTANEGKLFAQPKVLVETMLLLVLRQEELDPGFTFVYL